MAQRGRKPKPVAAKLAAGNPGKRVLTTLVPAPAPGDMLCPQSVQRNERAFAYWSMYFANAAPGHLSPIDAPLLARLCTALAYADEANEKIQELGFAREGTEYRPADPESLPSSIEPADRNRPQACGRAGATARTAQSRRPLRTR